MRLDESTAEPTSKHRWDNEYYIARAKRKRLVRARTVSMARLTKTEREVNKALYPESEILENQRTRPTTRGDCSGVARPCPWVGCKHNLYLDVDSVTGAIKLNFPDIEPDEMCPTASCALDIADHGGATLEEVGDAMNIVRERIRQLEVNALAQVLRQNSEVLSDWRTPGQTGSKKRRLPVLVEEEYEEEEL